MLERLSLPGLRHLPRFGGTIKRSALLAALVASVWSNNSHIASAQLRSGGVERPLYYGQLDSPGTQAQRPMRTANNRTGTSGRMRMAADGPRSIMEQGEAGQESINAKPESVAPKATPQAGTPSPSSKASPEPLPYDDNMSVMNEGEYYSDDPMVQGHSGGCSCGRCGQDRYFADLAPGCYDSSCGIGCGGPLSRLLGSLSVRGEVPLTWRRAIQLPQLVTNSATRTNNDLIFGDQPATEDLQAGVRLTFSTWLDPTGYRGVVVRYNNAGDQKFDFNVDSNSQPTIARPFINVTSGTAANDTQLVASPGDSTGSIHVGTTSSVDGFDIVMKRLGYRDRFTRVDWLLGYQHNRVAESLQIDTQTTVTGNVPPLTGSSISVLDRFSTTNTFNGAVIGLMSSRQFAYWKFEAMGRMGLGSMERRVEFAGSTTTTSSTGTVSVDNQGLLVRDTNNRPFQDNTFAVVPEFGFNAGYFLTRNIDFTIGYNYLLLGKVAQPGEQIDNVVNLSDPLTGASRPRFNLDTHKYWLHSLNFGAQWRY